MSGLSDVDEKRRLRLNELSEEARLHATLWDLGPGVFSTTLMAIALRRDFKSLHGFLDALEAVVLPGASWVLADWQAVRLDKDLLKTLPDRRDNAIGPLFLPVMDMLSMPLHSPDGSDPAHPWRDLQTLDEEALAFLARALKVLHGVHIRPGEPVPPGGLDSSRSSPFDLFVAAIFSRCRNTQAISMALTARGYANGPINAKTRYNQVKPDVRCSLAELALVHTNPAALTVLLDQHDQAEETQKSRTRATLKDFTARDQPVHEIVMQMISPTLDTPIKETLGHMILAVRDEMDAGTQHDNSAMTRCLRRLVEVADKASPLLGAYLHSLLLSQACCLMLDGLERSEMTIKAIYDMRQGPLSPWYGRALEIYRSEDVEELALKTRWMVLNTADEAACAGRHEVVDALAPLLAGHVADYRNDALKRGDHHTTGILFHNACVSMCRDDRQIPLARFKATVEALTACGYSVQDTAHDISINTALRGATTLHEMARQAGELVLPAMVQMLALGCDPLAKEKKWLTPERILKGKALDKPWCLAVRSHKVRQQAQAALDELAAERLEIREIRGDLPRP